MRFPPRERAAEPYRSAKEGAAVKETCRVFFRPGACDLDAALDEINTLMEVQVALQEASEGFLFLPWNGNLSEPWQG